MTIFLVWESQKHEVICFSVLTSVKSEPFLQSQRRTIFSFSIVTKISEPATKA